MSGNSDLERACEPEIRISTFASQPSKKAGKYAQRLDAIDVNKDGIIDRAERLEFIHETVESEKQGKLLRVALIVSTCLLVLFAAATAGIVYAVVVLTKDVATQTTNINASMLHQLCKHIFSSLSIQMMHQRLNIVFFFHFVCRIISSSYVC